MKIIFAEHQADYDNYIFSYAPYARFEPGDKLSDIYEKGFLPYSGDTTLSPDHFYLCRSLRVDLRRFSESSENRRINRLATEFPFEFFVSPYTNGDQISDEFKDLALLYAIERFSNDTFTDERLWQTLQHVGTTHLAELRTGGKIAGALILGLDDQAVHYYFAFFDTTLAPRLPLGKYLMQTAIEWARNNGRQHVYLGTCYNDKAIYKFCDFKGCQFYDGRGWNDDMRLLKQLCRGDKQNPGNFDALKPGGWLRV